MWKTSGNSQLRDISQNTLPFLLKTVKVIRNEESLRNCHSHDEPKEKWQLNVVWGEKKTTKKKSMDFSS